MGDLWHAEPGDNDLHGDTEAMHWAERFASRFEVTKRPRNLNAARTAEEGQYATGALLAWFASAIETGKMAATPPPPPPPGAPPGMVRLYWNDGQSEAWIDVQREQLNMPATLAELPTMLDDAMTKQRGDEGNDEL